MESYLSIGGRAYDQSSHGLHAHLPHTGKLATAISLRVHLEALELEPFEVLDWHSENSGVGQCASPEQLRIPCDSINGAPWVAAAKISAMPGGGSCLGVQFEIVPLAPMDRGYQLMDKFGRYQRLLSTLQHHAMTLDPACQSMIGDTLSHEKTHI